MGQQYVSDSSYLNPRLLETKFRRRAHASLKLSALMRVNQVKNGERIGNIGDADNPQFSGQPIEQFRQFVKLGRTYMDIPILERMVGNPSFGDTQIKGKGETRKWYFRTITLNRYRKAASLVTGMSKQRMGPELAAEINKKWDGLIEHYGDWTDGNLNHTFLTGYDGNLTNLLGIGDTPGLTPFSHPNTYVAGVGKTSYSGGRPGSSGYETAWIANLNKVNKTDTKYRFSCGLIRDLAVEGRRLNIKPIKVEGREWYVMVIKDSQWLQLQNDQDWKDAMLHTLPRDWNNPIYTAAEARYGDVLLYVDRNLFGVQTGYSSGDFGNIQGNSSYQGMPMYGPTSGNWISNSDSSEMPLAILMGETALSEGIANEISYHEQIDDHDNVQEVSMERIASFVRNDIFDKDAFDITANSVLENTSSLICATYTPINLSFGS